MRAAEPTSGELAVQLDVLVQELWTWSPSRWNDGRVATMRALALELVACAVQSEASPPAGAVLPVVAPYGIADQIAVLGRDLLAAPHPERAEARALVALKAARTALR